MGERGMLVRSAMGRRGGVASGRRKVRSSSRLKVFPGSRWKTKALITEKNWFGSASLPLTFLLSF